MVDCGREASYAADRIPAIRDIAAYALRTGREVVWS